MALPMRRSSGPSTLSQSPGATVPPYLTFIPDELPGLGFREGGDLRGPGMAAGLLEALEGHILAVDDAVGQCLCQGLLVLLQGRAMLGPTDGSPTCQHSPRPGAAEPGQVRTARGVLMGGSIPTMSNLPARNRASRGPPICYHHNKERPGAEKAVLPGWCYLCSLCLSSMR